MRCNCSHLCRLSSSCVRFANSAHFSACRLKNFTEAMLGRLAFPGFCIAAFIILRCNENCIAPQQVSDWLGNDGARGHESGNVAQRLARPRTINMQQFPERSALPCRGTNQTARRRIIRFHRPLLACALRLRACESGPRPRSAIHPVVPELMRKGGRRYEKLARSTQGRHRGSRGIRQDRSHGLAVQAHARSLRHSPDYQ